MNHPTDQLPARALLLDRDLIQSVYAQRTAHGNPPHDEVWDGMLVLFPLPDNQHRELVVWLGCAFLATVSDGVFPGCNVSDREIGWLSNYRCPDVAVYLASNPAKDCGTHWMGGPDLAVEIPSPGEDPREKLVFYAKVGTRELLIVDREPWKIELYQLRGGKLSFAGMSDVENPAVLPSVALPLTFQMQPGTSRPTIRIVHTSSSQTWTA